MTTARNNEIARAIYLALKDAHPSHFKEKSVLFKIVEFLNRRRLLGKTSDILSRLTKLINTETGVLEAKIWSTHDLSPKAQEELGSFLKERYETEQVAMFFNIEPKLVGGVKIQVKDEVIDLSIQNKMFQLEKYLTGKDDQ